MHNILKVYGISQEKRDKLKKLALKTSGHTNLSKFIKETINHLLNENIQAFDSAETPGIEYKRKTLLHIRVTNYEKKLLEEQSKKLKQSVNSIVSQMISNYLTNSRYLSLAEVEVLHHSNFQLLRIGRNLNQIAKALNMMEATSINYQLIKEVETTILEHTQKINNVLLANQRRFKNA